MADIAIRFWDLMALSRDQKKLFPHFGEAGTAVFAVEDIEYGGHDPTSLFDLHHQPQAVIFLRVQDVNQITAQSRMLITQQRIGSPFSVCDTRQTREPGKR